MSQKELALAQGPAWGPLVYFAGAALLILAWAAARRFHRRGRARIRRAR